MLGNEETVAWLTPHATVISKVGLAVYTWEQLDESCHFCFSADGKDVTASASSTEHLLEIVDVVLRLLAVGVVDSLILHDWSSLHGTFIHAPTLAYLIEHCQSLKFLSLKRLEMDENHCRVLGDFSRPDLEIVLDGCRVTSVGTSALVEVLGQNQGPNKLCSCFEIDNFVLVDGLRGNSRLKSLRPRFSRNAEVHDRELLAIAGALRENKGLVAFDLTCYGLGVSDETWDTICESLKIHPTLEVLDLRKTGRMALVRSVLNSRIQALLNMVKVNMSIHTIHLDPHYSQHELFQRSVIPYLETNRFRTRVCAIQRTRPIAYRAKVLGRALLSARLDANRFWMLLSGNAEVASPSIAAAASLPTPSPATAAATSTANVVAAATISPATATSSVVAPVSGQKRKASP